MGGRTMIDERGDPFELMRVVRYPWTDDIGVVIRTISTRRRRVDAGEVVVIVERHTVLWHDGHDDDVDTRGRLRDYHTAAGAELPPRVVTVTRSVRECRRILDLHATAPVE